MLSAVDDRMADEPRTSDGAGVLAELRTRNSGTRTHGVRHLLGRRANTAERRPAPIYKIAQRSASSSAVAKGGDRSTDGAEGTHAGPGQDVDLSRPDDLDGSAEDDPQTVLFRRQGAPLPYDSEALKTLLYNAAWRKAEDGTGVDAPGGEATSRELVRTLHLPLQNSRERACAQLCELLTDVRKAALDRLEVEYNAQSKILERKSATPESLLARLAAAGAKLLTEMYDETNAGVAAQLAIMAKEHKELLSIVRGKTDRMVGELIQESKQALHNRHGWRSAEVAQKLEGAQMAARSAAEAEWRRKLESAMQRERALMQKVAHLNEANQMLTASLTASNAEEECEQLVFLADYCDSKQPA